MAKVKRSLGIGATVLLTVALFFVLFLFYRVLEMDVPSLMAWALLFAQVLYRYSEFVYWMWLKSLFYISNPTTEWEFSARYEGLGGFGEDSLLRVAHCLCELASIDRARINVVSPQRIEVRADSLQVELYWQPEEDILELTMEKMKVSYRHSRELLEKIVSPVFETAERNFSLRSKSYWFISHFKRQNPYFSLFIRRLGSAEIDNLNLVVKEEKDSEITVTKDYVRLEVSSLTELNSISGKYLTLSKIPK